VKNGDEFVCECSHGWEGDTCEIRTNPCEDSPCKNGATCRVAASLEAVCICPPGLTGLTCEEKGRFHKFICLMKTGLFANDS
jgi:Notch-like protein